jgi:hypothetical protein
MLVDRPGCALELFVEQGERFGNFEPGSAIPCPGERGGFESLLQPDAQLT